MCLIVENSAKIRQANLKVPSWKVLYREMDGTFWAPYYSGFEYRLGHMAYMKFGKHLVIEPRRDYTSLFELITLKTDEYCVRYGLHSYVRKEDAESQCNHFNKTVLHPNGNYVVVSCYIPVEASFVEGVDETGVPCYVSSKLFVEEPKKFI